MKMAKASQADLNMAMELSNALDLLGHRFFPTMPEDIEALGEYQEGFYRDDDAQCGRALRHLLAVAERGSLMRVVWGCAVMLDPKNQCVDPDADTIEHHPTTKAAMAAKQTRPLDEWTEDMSVVLWWRFPIEEEPYVGHPNCSNWPGYHTHWTPLIVPDAPSVATGEQQ